MPHSWQLLNTLLTPRKQYDVEWTAATETRKLWLVGNNTSDVQQKSSKNCRRNWWIIKARERGFCWMKLLLHFPPRSCPWMKTAANNHTSGVMINFLYKGLEKSIFQKDFNSWLRWKNNKFNQGQSCSSLRERIFVRTSCTTLRTTHTFLQPIWRSSCHEDKIFANIFFVSVCVSIECDVMPRQIFEQGLGLISDIYVELLNTDIKSWLVRMTAGRLYLWQ